MKNHFVMGFLELKHWLEIHYLSEDKRGPIKITIEFPTLDQKHNAEKQLMHDFQDMMPYIAPPLDARVPNTLLGIPFEFTSREKLHVAANYYRDRRGPTGGDW